MRDSSRAADSAAAEATDNQFAAICKIKAVAKPSSKVSNSLFFVCAGRSCALIIVVTSSVPAKHVQNRREKDHPPLLGILGILGILRILGCVGAEKYADCICLWRGFRWFGVLITVGYQFKPRPLLCKQPRSATVYLRIIVFIVFLVFLVKAGSLSHAGSERAWRAQNW